MNLPVTFFSNYAAASKTEQSLGVSELARRIEITTAASKASLPWLKLAWFGNLRSEKNSLRHDANLLAVSGCEADYDAERIGFDQAVETAGAAGILCIVYTSPSHTAPAPRWRVLCPFSRLHLPERRDRFLARLNGLFGGVFANESWTRSQSYYFGSVNGNPAHRVAVLDGVPIDRMVELDAIAIGKPAKPTGSNGGQRAATTDGATNGAPKDIGGNTRHEQLRGADAAAITDKRIAGQIEALLDNVRNAPDKAKHYTLRSNARALGGYLHLAHWTEEQAVKELVKALPDSVKDWKLARRTAAWAVAEGKKKPQTLPDRPYQGRWPA